MQIPSLMPESDNAGVLARFNEIRRQRGLFFAFKRGVLRLIRPLYQSWTYVLAARDLAGPIEVPQLPSDFSVIDITEENVDRIARDLGFTENRLGIFRRRLSHNARGLAVEDREGRVCYMTWYARGPLPHLGPVNQMELKAGEVIIVDSVCGGGTRNLGIHTALFQYCLSEARSEGYSRAYVFHLEDNIPAIRVHEHKAGMKRIRKYQTSLIRGKARLRVIEIP